MAYQRDWRDDEAQSGGTPAPTPAAPAAPGFGNLDKFMAPATDGKQNTSGIIGGQTSPDATTTSGDSAKPAPMAAPAPSQQGTGSGFVNLQAYMDGNQGEGGRMVKDATAGLQEQGRRFQGNAVQTVADQTAAMKGAAGGDKLPGIRQGLATDATANAGTASDFVHSGYAGPTADEADAGLAAQQKDIADKMGSVSGDSVVASLGQQSKTPYTSGFGTLDKFLTGDASGKQAIDTIHGKASVINAAGNNARDQLGASEAAARKQLADNQQAVRSAAQHRTDAITGQGAKQAAALNYNLDKDNYAGVVDNSLGDGLSDKDRSDLEALRAITGGDTDAAWYTKTGNKGTAVATDSSRIPVPNPYQDWTSGSGGGDDGGAAGGINKFIGDQKAHGKSLGDQALETAQTPSAQNIANTSVQAFEQPAQSAGALDTATKQALGSAIPTAPAPQAPTLKAPSLKKRKPWGK